MEAIVEDLLLEERREEARIQAEEGFRIWREDNIGQLKDEFLEQYQEEWELFVKNAWIEEIGNEL